VSSRDTNNQPMVQLRSSNAMPGPPRSIVSRQATAVLVGVTVLLVIARFASRRIAEDDPRWSGLRTVFDFDQEATLPTWWNAMLLAAIAATLILAGALGIANERPSRRSLFVAGGVAGYLATDEAAQIHELFNAPINVELERRDLDIDTFVWVIPGAVVAAVIVYVAYRWSRSLPAAITRDLAIALTLYFAGAIGVEALSGWLLFGEDDDRYSYAVLLEELVEMTAAIVALRGVSRLLTIDHDTGAPALRRNRSVTPTAAVER
jgi:hypothetical protein